MTARRLAICADDYGRDADVCRGIVALARQGRLTATSCLTGGAAWVEWAPALVDLPVVVERGLHFNLTEGRPRSVALGRLWPEYPVLPRLLAMAHLRRLPMPAIADEWRAQRDAFRAATGREPDFIDGHQHVHHLPGVRELVVADAAAAGIAVRHTGRVIGPGFAFKRAAIAWTGGRALGRLLRARGVAHNRALVGVYDFAQADYRALLQRWLAALPAEGTMLFCHPAADGERPDPTDPIAAARRREAQVLASPGFADDLAAAGVTLAAAWGRRSSGG